MNSLLFRMWRIWRRPPSRTKIIIMLVALGLSLGLVAIERTVGLPDWMRTNGHFRVHHLPRL